MYRADAGFTLWRTGHWDGKTAAFTVDWQDSRSKENVLCLHFDLGLLQLVHLLTDHLHLLELSGHCVICQLETIQ